MEFTQSTHNLSQTHWSFTMTLVHIFSPVLHGRSYDYLGEVSTISEQKHSLNLKELLSFIHPRKIGSCIITL